MKKLSEANINSFIYSSYFFDNIHEMDNVLQDYEYNEAYNNLSLDEIIPYGKELLFSIIEKNFEKNKTHYLPLSGGLDSRLVLAVLLEFTEAKNIHTYTYGTPKTLDYDIGNEVAKKLGTNHTQLDLRMQDYNIEELIDMSNRIKNQTILFHHPPIDFIKDLPSDINVWSGFLGEHTGGASSKYDFNMTQSRELFLKNVQFNHSIKFSDHEMSHIANLIPDFDLNLYKNLTNYEIIDIVFEQRRLTKPHLLFEGPEYKVPYIEKEWLDFTLSINRKYRQNEYFYREIMVKNFPDIFDIRAKNFGGLSMNSSKVNIFRKKAQNRLKNNLSKKTNLISNPLINYVDFSTEIRINESLKNVISETLADFQKRDIVNINLEKKLKEHIDKKGNYTDLLLIIASLELNFKALERKGYSI